MKCICIKKYLIFSIDDYNPPNNSGILEFEVDKEYEYVKNKHDSLGNFYTVTHSPNRSLTISEFEEEQEYFGKFFLITNE